MRINVLDLNFFTILLPVKSTFSSNTNNANSVELGSLLHVCSLQPRASVSVPESGVPRAYVGGVKFCRLLTSYNKIILHRITTKPSVTIVEIISL